MRAARRSLCCSALARRSARFHVAVPVATDHHDAVARHDSAGRVGAVGAGRDQADIARTLPLGFVIGADGQQPGVLALAARIGLQADGGEPGYRAQPGFQRADQRGVASRLRQRREGVDIGEARQGDRHHLRRGIQLHGAAAQRDHAAVQRDVLVFQSLQVAQHLVLGVMGGEHRLRQKGAGAQQRRRQAGRSRDHAAAQNRGQALQFFARHRLVQGHGDAFAIQAAQVEPRFRGTVQQGIGIATSTGAIEGHGVEIAAVAQVEPRGLGGTGQQTRHQVHAACDAAQPFRARARRRRGQP